ncbi:hypothetical protein MBLNU459_g0540t1 [Dothideomycetes sp. NU459]
MDEEGVAASSSASMLHRAPTLRKTSQSETAFTTSTMEEHIHKNAVDKDARGHKRGLPGNEVIVMALNEIAAQRRRGFFFHLLTREGWKKWPKSDLVPESRRAEAPGADYPTILYMDYVWSEDSYAAFLDTPHRNRYLICDAIMNPPPEDTPLYAVQYVSYKTCPVYVTAQDSLVLFTTDSCFYLAKTSELDSPAVLGRWRSRRAPSGPDPTLRLATCPYLWDGSETAVEEEVEHSPRAWAEEKAAMEPYRISSLEQLYYRFVRLCRAGGIASTFDARHLRSVIPRPRSPEPGVALGTPLGEGRDFSDPPTSRGTTLKRASRARGSSRVTKPVAGSRRGDSADSDQPGSRIGSRGGRGGRARNSRGAGL